MIIFAIIYLAMQAKVVKEWALEHQAELLENWKRIELDQTLFKIPGADQ
jgi:hypothetical protein